ncbi:MAG: Nramp family divalent metal transporter [Opitutales bacterium]|nr:Nramp family divalent metal transporter [Opitutales bacterium]
MKTDASNGLRAWRALGPGLLMAGAAIGVSHIVQSTRAGADFGWQLLWVVLLVNLFKYPFFEYGHRYAVATGESLLHGYARLGRFYLWGFLVLTTVTAIISIAGVTIVTAALAENFFSLGWSLDVWSLWILGLCLALISIGRYRALDVAMKAIMAVLLFATVVAFLLALRQGPAERVPEFVTVSPWTAVGLGFVIALMGWMPGPIELSTLQSLWVGAKERATGRRFTRAGAALDFNLGYGLTVVLSVLFLAMGALVMYGSGESYAAGGAAFASQFIALYTGRLGEWAGPFIAIAALTTMFSTTLAVMDAYPRALAVGGGLVVASKDAHARGPHLVAMVVCGGLGVILIHFFRAELIRLIDFATIIAFLAAPVFAYLNLRLVCSSALAPEDQPPRWLRMLSVAGLVYLVGFGVIYLWMRFIVSLF